MVATSTASDFVPYIPPPPGVIPNPTNPPSLAYETYVTAGISVGFVTVFYLARLWARVVIKKTWIFEDWLALGSWLGTIAYAVVVVITMAKHGGRHVWDIDVEQAKEVLYWFNISSVVYSFIICLTKVSVLVLYRRVFSPTLWCRFDIMVMTLIVLMVLFYTSTSIAKIMQCNPRAKIWDQSVPGTCINEATLLNTNGIFNTVTDYIILLLPVNTVLRLQLSQTKKLLVVFVFTFGLCAPIFSTIGLVVRFQISNNTDITWYEPEILLWGAAEITSGFLIVCFPEMSFLITRRLRKETNTYQPTIEAALSRTRFNHSHSRSRKIGSDHDDMAYYELDDDVVYGVRVSPTGSSLRLNEPAHGTVQVHHEIIVESNKKDDVMMTGEE